MWHQNSASKILQTPATTKRRQGAMLRLSLNSASSLEPFDGTGTAANQRTLHEQWTAAFVAMRQVATNFTTATANRISWRIVTASVSAMIILATIVTTEIRSSWIEAQIISWIRPEFAYSVEEGINPALNFPQAGPFDVELGYSLIPQFSKNLKKLGIEIKSQARLSTLNSILTSLGFSPAYQEKQVHGLHILDATGATLFEENFPKERYASFQDIPAVVSKTLLFIEDRQLLDDKRAKSLNPAVSWDRLTKASFEMILDKVVANRNVPGGSTLATQIEKFRHSPEGRTHNAAEKLQQMASATMRAYLLGHDTRVQREQIVVNYINEVPLGAVPGIGEIKGLGEALTAWFGDDFKNVNKVLASQPDKTAINARRRQAQAFKRILSLFLSQRRPAYYLQQDQRALESLANVYIPLLQKAGVISNQLAGDALAINAKPLRLGTRRATVAVDSFIDRKAANAVRHELKSLLQVNTLYELDRLDTEVQSTFDRDLQKSITKTLLGLRSTAGAIAAGIVGEHMLTPVQAAAINYSFTLIERRDDHNVVRALTDTVDSPLDLNRGGKLELGSTAKLRTLVTYLEMVAELYKKSVPHLHLKDREQAKIWLAQKLADVSPEDELSQWLYRHLEAQRSFPDLSGVLEAAMNRTFSASPWQAFRTAGGMIHFANFNPEDNGLNLSVAQAFQRSNNLVFVRLMKDIVQHVINTRIAGAKDMLLNPHDPLRGVYLRRFVNYESTAYLRRFYRDLKPLSAAQRMTRLLGIRPATPARLATILLSIRQDYDFYAFRLLMLQAFPKLEDAVVLRYWRTLNPQIMSLNDRAFTARVHPLALWMAMHLQVIPDATFQSAWVAAKNARFSSYKWLLKRSSSARQERDIRTMLEREAFNKHIVNYWRQQGFPFTVMTPSYGSALGSSGDRPAALANLMGALNNNGVMLPTVQIEEIRFGKNTPYETTFGPSWRGATRIASPEVAAAAKKALVSVVEGGSARRLYQQLVRMDGTEVPIAAKTGTGDNRLESYSSSGRLLKSDAKSRTATLVFALGDRFYGTITAYVKADSVQDSRAIGDFSFTSSLVVQALRSLLPDLQKTVMRVEDPLSLAQLN